jgi:hypothetical protein
MSERVKAAAEKLKWGQDKESIKHNKAIITALLNEIHDEDKAARALEKANIGLCLHGSIKVRNSHPHDGDTCPDCGGWI